MTELDLDAIQARADAATPGPWVDTKGYHLTCLLEDENDCERTSAIRERIVFHNGVVHHEHDERQPSPELLTINGDLIAGAYDWEEWGILKHADTEFIVHAREDIPALVAEVRRLRAIVERQNITGGNQ